MNSLLRTFRNVVELGEEESRGAMAPLQPGSLHEQSDPAELRQHISTLSQKLARQVQSYEELREESISMEKELTRVRLRFVAARKLWEYTNESLELTIQNLVEQKLFGAASIASPMANRASGSSSGTASPTPANASLLHSAYVASLREQIRELREMVMQSSEERNQVEGEKQYVEAQRVLRANGVSDSHLNDEVRAALQKLVAHWSGERASYEAVIESLELNAAKHAEREALLSDCVKQEQERSAEATARISSAEFEELRRLRDELAKWQHGERAAAEGVPVDSNRSCDTVSPVSIIATPQSASADVNGASPVSYDVTNTNPLASLTYAGATDGTGAPLKLDRALGTDTSDGAVIEKLERLRRDCSARDEALDNLYRDNRSLQEALQRTESRVRASEAELQQREKQMVELAERLSREQQRVKQLEDENRRGAVNQGKLHEQVMQLRRALSATVVGQAQFSDEKGLSAGVAIPLVAAGRAKQLYHASTLEHSATHEKAAAWEGWTREAARWAKGFKGFAMTSRVPQVRNGTSTAHARASWVSRRNSCALAMLGGILAILMLAYMLFTLVDSTRAARRSREAA
ncbi:hypothetical protein LSCM4_02776 [Leishmania orientalis]|uniref:Uncharacterized protein n=1 Tax=Leishmania orientalis TaxID=2249476 RepID=A0A836FVF7_9TRYP|nr:hypothetical protein LSCM4_02776 [Leishmania orientalis]